MQWSTEDNTRQTTFPLQLTIEQHGTHSRSGWTYVPKAVSPRRIGHVTETVLQVPYIHKHSQ